MDIMDMVEQLQETLNVATSTQSKHAGAKGKLKATTLPLADQ